MLKKILIVSMISISTFTLSNDNVEEKTTAEKIETITEFYLSAAEKIENDTEKLTKLQKELEAELEFLSIARQEIELRTNLIQDLYIDIEDTKNLYFLEFDETGSIKKRIANNF